MTAASVTHSGQHLVEALVKTLASGSGTSAGAGVVGLITGSAVSVAVPSIADSTADTAIVMESVDVTVTGVARGDVVIGVGFTAALPTDCHFVQAYVSATDTVTFEFRATKNQPVTGATKAANIVVLDLT